MIQFSVMRERKGEFIRKVHETIFLLPTGRSITVMEMVSVLEKKKTDRVNISITLKRMGCLSRTGGKEAIWTKTYNPLEHIYSANQESSPCKKCVYRNFRTSNYVCGDYNKYKEKRLAFTNLTSDFKELKELMEK